MALMFTVGPLFSPALHALTTSALALPGIAGGVLLVGTQMISFALLARKYGVNQGISSFG